MRPADKLQLKASIILPPVGRATSKQDPITRGHGAQSLCRPASRGQDCNTLVNPKYRRGGGTIEPVQSTRMQISRPFIRDVTWPCKLFSFSALRLASKSDAESCGRSEEHPSAFSSSACKESPQSFSPSLYVMLRWTLQWSKPLRAPQQSFLENACLPGTSMSIYKELILQGSSCKRQEN